MNARVSTDPRLSRRRKAIARVRRRRIWMRCGALGAAGAAVAVALWSPLLEVRDVRLVGGRHTTPQEVARAAGLDGGSNLLLLSPEEVARRVRRLAWVERAEVARVLPRTLRVRIVERRPAAVLVAASPTAGAGRGWLVDERGVVLGRGEARRGLPALAVAGESVGAPGERLRSEEARAAARVLSALPRSLRHRVVAAFAPSVERITLSLADGTLVRYGPAEDLGAKNAVLHALLRRLGPHPAPGGYIDVRVPRSPAVASNAASALAEGLAGAP